MAEPCFDPGGFYEFDLAAGAVRTRHGGRVLVLSDNVVGPLVSAAVHHGDLTAVRQMGKEIGADVQKSMSGEVADHAPADVIQCAADLISVFGWGRLSTERWGDALAIVMREGPKLDEGRLGVAALLGGVFSILGGAEVACVPIDSLRFLVVSPSIAEQVWMWSREGTDVSSIVGRLEAGEK